MRRSERGPHLTSCHSELLAFTDLHLHSPPETNTITSCMKLNWIEGLMNQLINRSWTGANKSRKGELGRDKAWTTTRQGLQPIANWRTGGREYGRERDGRELTLGAEHKLYTSFKRFQLSGVIERKNERWADCSKWVLQLKCSGNYN